MATPPLHAVSLILAQTQDANPSTNSLSLWSTITSFWAEFPASVHRPFSNGSHQWQPCSRLQCNMTRRRHEGVAGSIRSSPPFDSVLSLSLSLTQTHG
ncbi:hypothetical protein Hanom_Chr16g01448381 [Helianthus anomalus]